MNPVVAHSDDPQARIEYMIQNDPQGIKGILSHLIGKVKLSTTERPQAYQDFKATVKNASEQ